MMHVWRPLPHYPYPSLAPEKCHTPCEEGTRGAGSEDRGVQRNPLRGHLVLRRPTEAILDLAEDLEAS